MMNNRGSQAVWRLTMKTLLASIAMLFGLSGAAQATLIEMVFDFTGGFSASFNGGANAPTGRLTFRVLVDSTTSDQRADVPYLGDFVAKSVRLTAPVLGLTNELVVAPDPLFILTFGGGPYGALVGSRSSRLRVLGNIRLSVGMEGRIPLRS